MIQFDRYRVMEYDEALRLWCTAPGHYEDLGCELGTWSDCVEVSVLEIVALCAQHELAEHSEPSFTDAHTQPGLLSG